MFHAKKMVQSIADEEEEKKKLVEDQKTVITEKLEQVMTMKKFMVQKTKVEQEFFKDNHEMIKRENTKIERARKREENANEVLDEMIPKLEAVAGGGDGGDNGGASSSSAELTVEKIIETMITDNGPYGEIGRKII